MGNGYKPKVVKIGISEVTIKMPQVRGTDEPLHSKILPPYVKQAEEITKVIPLLYMNGILTRKVK